MTGGPLNLSLLSRGVGEVQKNGHEKVEVFLEPEDYYNFSKNVDRFYLPPITTTYPSFLASTPGFTARSSREAQEFRVPKTFTTRKGALLLFSEDLAQRNMERAAAKRKAAQQSQHSSLTPSTSLDAQVSLNTVEDLAHSILQYGSHVFKTNWGDRNFSKDRTDDKICLKFLHARRDNFERQIRPGFSAKRYLSTWSRTWDDTVFDNVIKQGFITERSLYHYNLVLPHLRRRLFHEDLSHMPQPYRLMRNMLMAPGSLSGYTFYRAPTIEIDEAIEEEMHLAHRRNRLRSIRVVKTQGGLQEEVLYSDLDKQSQKEVITDLLVKSAVHYALKKQEEIYQDTIIQAIHSEQHPAGDEVAVAGYGDYNSDQQQALVVKTHEFDMQNAVDSLLDSQHGRLAIGADLPEIDDRSQVSEMAGSFKGSTAIPHHLNKQTASQRPSWPTDASVSEKEFVGNVPVASMKEGSVLSDSSSHQSSVPQLPPIRHTLSPIHDVSRETTQPHISLPPIGHDTLSTDPPTVTVVPATPQHSITMKGSSSHDPIASDQATRGLLSRDAHGTQDLLEEDEGEAEVKPHYQTQQSPGRRKKMETSSSSVISSDRDKGKGKGSSHIGESGEHVSHLVGGSSTSGTVRSRPQWKTSTRRGPGSVVESVKGSMVMAPDGEIISVGGSVARGGVSTDVGNLNDVPTGYRLDGIAGAGTDDSGASDDEPDEWKNTKKFSISNKSDSLKKVYKRGSASSSSVAKSDIERLGSAGKQILWDHASQAASEIDYTSGDIDATMSIHSWSYAVPEHEELGLHHATSVRSLPGLQLDGGGLKDTTSTADGHNDTHLSTESSDGEHWAKITERPEEEEIANIDSREIAMEEIEVPRVPSPSPASDFKEEAYGKEMVIHEEEEIEEDEEQKPDKIGSSPRSKSIGLQTDSEAGSHVAGKGLASKTPKTPGRCSEFDADDEYEGEEDVGTGWPSEQKENLLEVVKEASVEQSSRKESLVSKVGASRPESKTTSLSRSESKVDSSMAGKTIDVSKSAAPSVASERKSVATVEGKLPESGAATPDVLAEENATEEKPSGEDEKPTGKDSKAGSEQDKSRSVSQKSKAKSRASIAKSQASSLVGGRESTESSSPTKGVKSVSGKGDKSVSGKGDKSASLKGDASAGGRSSKRSKRSDSQAKSRATTGTKLSHAKLSTPPPTADAVGDEGENFDDNPWGDQDEDEEEVDVDRKEGEEIDNDFSREDDAEAYRMPSTPSEDNARISGDVESRRQSNLDLTIAGTQLLSPPSTPSRSKKRESLSRHSSVTEKDIMDTLTDHAQKIAESVLSQPMAGQDLEADVKQAATMWSEMHPPRPLSRAHSVREFRADAIEEIMRNRRASSAVPNAAEYKTLIKKSLTTAVAKAAGLDPDSISDDAEISPELLEALASQKLTPDQIEIVNDGEGRTRIQSRVSLGDIQAVQEGHIFIAPGTGETGSIKRQVSIPADRVSIVDDVEIDRISYQGTDAGSEKGDKRTTRSKAGSKPGSIAGGTMADLREVEGMMADLEGRVEGSGKTERSPQQDDDFLAAVRKVEGKDEVSSSAVKRTGSGKTTPSAVEVPVANADEDKKSTPTLPDGVEDKRAEDVQSVKSGKTGVSQKSVASKDSKKKEKEEPFVVGKVDDKGENERLYGRIEPPPLKPEPEPENAPPPAVVEEESYPSPPPQMAQDTTKTEGEPGTELPAEVAVSEKPAVTSEPGGQKGDGLMDHMDELTKLYGGKPPAPPPKPEAAPKGKPREKKPKKEAAAPKKEEKKKKGKKGKKSKKKDEEAALIEEMRNEIEGRHEDEPQPQATEPAVEITEPTPRESSAPTSEYKASSPDFRTDESDGEYHFVREASSPEMDIPQTRIHIPSPPIEEEDKSDEDAADDNEDDGLKAISNREARAAKRAAAAAKRREEVERRRREKEELAKREKEEVERQMALQREMEEERRRREEERRLRKEYQKEAELRELKEQEDAEKRAKFEAEREKRAKDEYQRKLEEIKRKQHEDELRRHELMLQKQKEEEERRLAEEELMSQMAEQERIEYEKKKKEEEAERKRKEEEEKLRRIEEAKKAMEEAQRLAEEMARKQAELEARLKFNKDLQVESSCLGHSQGINRAFVFSYFELLQWLGLDIPEFELAKLADY